jgi:hypothetical protein
VAELGAHVGDRRPPGQEAREGVAQDDAGDSDSTAAGCRPRVGARCITTPICTSMLGTRRSTAGGDSIAEPPC